MQLVLVVLVVELALIALAAAGQGGLPVLMALLDLNRLVGDRVLAVAVEVARLLPLAMVVLVGKEAVVVLVVQVH